MRLLIDGADHQPVAPDRSLLRLAGQAHRFREMVMRGNGTAIASLAQDAGIDPSNFTRILKLSFLSPRIIAAIVDGRQPADLTAKQLTRKAGQLAFSWPVQAEQLGLR